MNKKANSLYGLRAKLISAMCMLLVAMIMVISSTYAWFTLSTAPEVKGINTAIGANGALEMALNYGVAPGEGIIASTAATALKNGYWGNLVDLSDDTYYGTNAIKLLPSELNATVAADGTVTIGGNMLKIPDYGPDGRVNNVTANTVTGTYYSIDATNGITEGTAFAANNNLGFRAVGVASGMTERELAYRAAKAAAVTAMGLAKKTAAVSLETKGSLLASIAIKHGTADPANSDTYSQTDVDALEAIVNDLLGTADTTGAIQYLEDAYKQYILAYAASNQDYGYQAVQSLVNGNNSLDTIIAKLQEGAGDQFDDDFLAPIKELKATRATVESARTAIGVKATDTATATGLRAKGDSIAWADISDVLNDLAAPEAMLVNDKTVTDIKADMGGFASEAMKIGVTVKMKSGGGVYADVADHAGNYKASISMDINYKGTELEDFPATMATDARYAKDSSGNVVGTTAETAYLVAISSANVIPGFTEDTNSTTVKPLTEFYGYVIDLAFRTNATESNLLLQTAATDRIYDDNKENTDDTDPNNTWGGGSTMTFSTPSTTFSADQMKSLLSNYRIVFFDPAKMEVLGVAMLDTTAVTNNGTEYEANIYMVQESVTVTTVVTKAADGTVVSSDADTVKPTTSLIVNPALAAHVGAKDPITTSTTSEPDADGNITTVTTSKKYELVKTQDDAKITALAQNTVEYVSALVYLDGTTIGNDDVAADASASVTGKLNLQFSSSANLVPMEYADFQNPSADTEKTGS